VNKLITVRHALEDASWLGSLMGGPTFLPMRALLIAAMGEQLSVEERAAYERVELVRQIWTLG
jgi:hypothetical protein